MSRANTVTRMRLILDPDDPELLIEALREKRTPGKYDGHKRPLIPRNHNNLCSCLSGEKFKDCCRAKLLGRTKNA